MNQFPRIIYYKMKKIRRYDNAFISIFDKKILRFL